jgi:hypothetical protein
MKRSIITALGNYSPMFAYVNVMKLDSSTPSVTRWATQIYVCMLRWQEQGDQGVDCTGLKNSVSSLRRAGPKSQRSTVILFDHVQPPHLSGRYRSGTSASGCSICHSTHISRILNRKKKVRKHAAVLLHPIDCRRGTHDRHRQ